MKRLFVIKNATHFLNVKNYIENKPSAENYVILTIGKFEGDREFIQEVRNSPNLKVLEVIFTKSDVNYLNYLLVFQNIFKVKQLSGKFEFFDEIIFTNYKNWIHHFILNQFESDKKLLLSDGAGILLIAEWRKNREVIPFESVPFGGKKFIMDNILGIKPIKHLHFYSQIKLEIPDYDSLEVFRFKSSHSTQVQKNKIYFIGSPLVELGHLSLNKQLNYLSQIKERFKDSDITYFAHRRERDEFLNEYSFFGEIVKNPIPFEEKMEKETVLPGAIFSYLSSVLINLTPIYPQIQFNYIPLNEEDLSGDPVFFQNYMVVRKGFEKIRESNFSKLSLDAVIK